MADVLDACVEQNLDGWAPTSARDQIGRAGLIKRDAIAKAALARLTVSGVERWHARLRPERLRDGGVRNRHTALRAALAQAVRWGWVSTKVASLARLRSAKVEHRGGT